MDAINQGIESKKLLVMLWIKASGQNSVAGQCPSRSMQFAYGHTQTIASFSPCYGNIERSCASPVQVLRAKRGHLKRGQWEAPREWGKMEGGPLETSLCETLHCSACWDRKVWGQCGPLMGHHLSLEFTASLLANCTSMPMAPWICHMHAWKGHNVEFYGHHEYHCEPWELICLLS